MNTLIAAAAILSAVAALVSAVKKKRRENSEALSRGNMTTGTSQQRTVSTESYDSRTAGSRKRKGSGGRSSSTKPADRTGRRAKTVHTAGQGRGRAAEQTDRIREKVRSASAAASKYKDRSRSVEYSMSCSDDSGYINSLQTLYRSGLLTKKEMNEMIEKHSKRKGAGE